MHARRTVAATRRVTADGAVRAVTPPAPSQPSLQARLGNRALGQLLASPLRQPSGQGGRKFGRGQQAGQPYQQPVQRQSTGQSSTPAITARTIMPFPVGSRLLLNRILGDIWFQMLAGPAPDVVALLTAIENQIATVGTSTDDRFAATVSTPISMPAANGQPARTLNNLTLSLTRDSAGLFTLQLSGTNNAQTPATTEVLFERADLTATRQPNGAIVLSDGTGQGAQPQLRLTSTPTATGTGTAVRLEAFTAPFVGQAPVPQTLDFVQITQLENVRAGTAEERRVVESIAQSVAGTRRQRRQRLTGGVGFLSTPDQFAPLFSAAWQINFQPVPAAGGFLQVPLLLQLQYAPSSSVLGGISSGVETSLSQLKVPINVRLLAGVAGGQLPGSVPEGGGDRPLRPAFGPTLGAGIGLELGSFRMDLDYQWLINVVGASPNAHTLGLGFGRAF